MLTDTLERQQIITGLHNIVTTATEDLRQMKDSQALTETADQDTVYDAFRDFASAHSELLNILIGKSGLFSTVPFIGQPLVAVLRSDEGAIDVSNPARQVEIFDIPSWCPHNTYR